MSDKSAVTLPSFGRERRWQPVVATAGVPMELRAADFLGEIADDKLVTWEVQGRELTGPLLKWTFNRPGRFRVWLTTSRKRVAVLVTVSLRLRDLVEQRHKLDFFYCLVAAVRNRWIIHPLLRDRPNMHWDKERARAEAAHGHPAFAAWLRRHGQSYRRHYGVLDVVRRAPMASGLYAVFPGSTVYVGTNVAIGRAVSQLEAMGTVPKGTPFGTAALEKALKGFDLNALQLGDAVVQPAAPTSFGGVVLSSLLNDLTSNSLDFVEAIGGSRSSLNAMVGSVI